ncbi:FMN-binding protein [Spirochaetia bacterium 38H-sp]|uniref:FMN-binding protein n=1 Tax=Rarispira pelagica TaxID=3141764 RepID=A0ABU9U8Y5_9SPIR
MNSKKFILLAIAALMVVALSACQGAPAKSYKDGIYFAQEDDFAANGWKSVVILEVKDGKIVKAVWNGANRDGKADKITRSMAGQYPIVEKGGAQAPWHEQAAKAVEYLLKTQDPDAVKYTDEEGHTDAISGVSIHVSDFFKTAKKALERGPVGYGPYKDGTYHAEQADFGPQGWKEYVDITVIGGRIVAAHWDAVHKDGGDVKSVRSQNGEYGMKEKGGSQAAWYEQAAKVEAYILKTQDPSAISYKDEEGHTDAISGVSIHVSSFFELAKEALKNAKK